jgi:hypothetical protein
MSDSDAASHRNLASSNGDTAGSSDETAAPSPWLTMVGEKVRSIRYGVVQITVHDYKVVQIECAERTRFEVPPATGNR